MPAISQGQIIPRQEPVPSDQQDAIQKLERSLDLINKNYVDTVNNAQLVEQAIIAMLKQLDPHSNYFTAEQIKRANEDLEGSFEGIGIEFQYFDDTAVVSRVVENGPSAKAGLRQGDRILKVGNEVATGTRSDNNWISKRVRGKSGTLVQLTVLRPYVASPMIISITRGKISTFSVDTYFKADELTGYIKVSKFTRTTAEEFSDGLKSLKHQGMEQLILDLRGNTGGYLNSAVQLADHFLGRNKIIVYTEGINSNRIDYKSTGKGNFQKGRLVILIDENSASASEILTGAIQDWDRGLVIGRRSFGKGLVQKPFTLNDGSAIRLTIARYYTPTGRSIQRPYDQGREQYYEEMNEKIRLGIYSNIDSLRLHDSLKRITPYGRVVYGGGGILPDILFAADTSGNTNYINALLKKNLFNRYALDWVISSRDSLLQRYPDVSTMLKTMSPTDPFKVNFTAFAEHYGVSATRKERSASQPVTDRLLTGTLARLLWGNQAAWQVTGSYDTMVLRALEVLNDQSQQNLYNLSHQQE